MAPTTGQPAAAAPAVDDEDCEVCKKGKKKSVAFQALMKKQGIAMPNFPVAKKSTEKPAGAPRPIECLAHTSESGAGAVGCPADRESLGRAGWTVLHTMAAYFPVSPSYSEQAGMGVFLRLFANFYPCKECREDFQTSLREDPPEVGGRTPLMLWMCRAHNRVNERLGKPLFDCSVSGVEERWKSGHPACDAEEHFEH